MEVIEAKLKSRLVLWLVPSLAIIALGTCSLVEPMRWRLPARYLFSPLEIHRTGFSDFTMCMRVALSPTEADEFVSKMFEAKDRVTRPVPMAETMCPAPFWPQNFARPTVAYNVDYWPNGMVEGSSGAVYEGGYVYFWSNTM